MTNDAYSHLDRVLAALSDTGPSLKIGFVNHAPMVAEALVAMERGEDALAWVEANLKDTMKAKETVPPLDRSAWQAALGDTSLEAQWSAFFAQQLNGKDWRTVLNLWSHRLAKGLIASATHGIIRVGHAARALGVEDTPLRRRELAEGLALWATTFQTLPEDRSNSGSLFSPADALAQVPLVPAGLRKNEGSITTGLEQVDKVPEFAPVIGLIDLSGNLGEQANKIAQVFAQVFLDQAHTPLTAIVYTHSITTVAALLNVAPHVSEETLRDLLAYGWQGACGLYSAYALSPTPGPGLMQAETAATIVEQAIAHGDDHVIKLSEACLVLYARTGDDRFLMMPSHARALL